MFRKKKLYRIVYSLFNTYTVVISTKDEHQAIRKFHRIVKDYGFYSIKSFDEIEVGRG